MTADFKMKFDDDGGPKKLSNLADSAEKTAGKLGDVGQSGAKAADAINDVGDEAKAAASKADSLDGSLSDVAGGATKAESSVESFTVSTDQMAKKMDAAADKAEHLARAQAKVASGGHAAGKGVDVAKDAFGGLDAILTTAGLPGLGSLAGGLERATTGFKDLSSAGGGTVGALTKIVIPLAAVYATYKSLETIFTSTLELVPEIRVQWDAFTESISGHVETARKLLNEYGFLYDESEELKKKNEELKATFEANNKALAEAQAKINPVTDAIKGLNDEIARGREQEKIDVEVQGVESVDEAERKVAEMMARLDEIRSRPAPTVDAANQQAAELEAVWKEYEPRVRALEDRRKQLQEDIKQRAAAEAQAAEAKKKQDEDAAKRADEEHAKELQRIEQEKQAKQKAADEQTKKEKEAAEQKRKAADADLNAAVKEYETRKKGVEEVKQAEASPQASSSTEQPNKYGEGEAPTAGKDNSQAYAAATEFFGNIGADFNIAGNSSIDTSGSQAGGSGDVAADLTEAINKKLTDSNIARTAKEEEMAKLQAANDEKRMQYLEQKYGTRDAKTIQRDEEREAFKQDDRALRKSYRDDERQAARDFDKTGPTDKQAEDAVQSITDKTASVFAKQESLDATKKEFYVKAADGLVDHEKRIVSQETAMKALLSQMSILKSSGRGGMPSHRQSLRAANP